MTSNADITVMDSPRDSPELILAAMISFICQNSFYSHWYRIWDRPDDNPKPELRRLMHEDELNKIIELNKSSLQRFIGIDDELWIWLLKRCDLVNESGDGKVSMTSEEKWISFFTTWEIDAEVILSAPLIKGARRYIRLGRKGTNWYNNVSKQAKNGKMDPPRCPSIQVIGRSLNAELRIMFEEEEYDEGDNWGDTCGNWGDTECIDNEDEKPRATERPSTDATTTKFPLLQSYGLANIDLSNEAENNKFKRLLGEMMAKQQQHSNSKNKIDLIQMQQNTTTSAVVVRSHKSEEAFQKYHRSNPYVNDVVGCLDGDDEEKVGARRLSDYLAKHHKNEFIDAANASGVAVCGVLDATESASLFTEAGLLDEQWNTIMRHLRSKFHAKIAVSLLDAKRKSYEGFTMPRVAIIYHRPGEKDEEKIVAEYQDIKAEFKKAVETLLRVHVLKKRKRVRRIRLIIGGDHGQGAFRLGFRVLIDTEEETVPWLKTINIATVRCKKEVGQILESTVIDWLAEDLRQINDNPLHLLNCNGKVVTCFECDMDHPEHALLDPIQVEQFIAGDLAWDCFCLGKEGAANSWCIYCKHGPPQWSVPNHDKGECWTMEDLEEMADSNKKGTKRMGVKRRTYFPWIPVENYILPVLHLKIGLGNNVIDYFGFLVEWRLTKLSQQEKAWKDRVDDLNIKIPERRQIANDWQKGIDGKRRTQLMALRRTRAPTNGVNGLNPAEVEELAALDATFTANGKLREELIAERTNLMKAIETAHESRRRPPKGVDRTWYLLMEQIYRKHGVKREDYHKRKFSGRPLKDIMRKAADIFNDAKAMLREFKDDSVVDIDDKIDEICDNMISLLSSWGEVFDIFYMKKPSEADKSKFKIVMAEAAKKHRALRKLVDDNDDTPKLHYAEDHGLEALERHPDLLLCIEEWVEQFHQTERKKVEDKVKFVKVDIDRAIIAAKKRAAVNNSDIQAQNRKTKKSRGSYDKGN